MATKFAKNITNGNGALARRATALETQAKISQETLINELKKSKTELEMKILNLTDFSPESKDSLRSGCKSFNSDQWVAELQRTKIELYQHDISIRMAEETYREFFTEEEA